MTLNGIWWGDFSSRTRGSVEHPFSVITPEPEPNQKKQLSVINRTLLLFMGSCPNIWEFGEYGVDANGLVRSVCAINVKKSILVLLIVLARFSITHQMIWKSFKRENFRFSLVRFYGIPTIVGYLKPNPLYIYIYIYIYIYVPSRHIRLSGRAFTMTYNSSIQMSNLFPAHKVKLTWIHRTDLERHGPGGGCVHCRDKTYLQDTSG